MNSLVRPVKQLNVLSASANMRYDEIKLGEQDSEHGIKYGRDVILAQIITHVLILNS